SPAGRRREGRYGAPSLRAREGTRLRDDRGRDGGRDFRDPEGSGGVEGEEGEGERQPDERGEVRGGGGGGRSPRRGGGREEAGEDRGELEREEDRPVRDDGDGVVAEEVPVPVRASREAEHDEARETGAVGILAGHRRRDADRERHDAGDPV